MHFELRSSGLASGLRGPRRGRHCVVRSSPFARGSPDWSARRQHLVLQGIAARPRSEEHTSELQSLMRISYAVFCLKKTQYKTTITTNTLSISIQRAHLKNRITPHKNNSHNII